MTCIHCGQELDPGRADFLAENSRPLVCMSCSSERPKVCFVSYDHKTAGHLVVVGNDPEQVRLATRAYKRQR